MSFTNADHPSAVGRDASIGISVGPRRGRLVGEEGGVTIGGNAPQPLIGEIDVEERTVVDPPAGSAVLVDEGSHVDVGWGDLRDLTVTPSHDGGAAALLGTRLGPPDGVAVGGRFVDPDRSFDE